MRRFMYSPIPLSRAEFVKYLKQTNKDDRQGLQRQLYYNVATAHSCTLALPLGLNRWSTEGRQTVEGAEQRSRIGSDKIGFDWVYPIVGAEAVLTWYSHSRG